ncbi:hypothetical protein QTP86_023382 [Hemibagrus guttatus]|nr:hypothetical protein QTP86_023382 [Hemibagrus guttatus]
MIREVFEYPAGGKDISLQLMELRQGSEAQSGWNDAALWAVFCAGLNPGLQAELACHVEATSLSQFVAMAIRLDNLRRQHRAGTQASASARPRVGGSSLFFNLTLPVSLRFSDRCVPVSALIDSGAAVNLIDGALVEELGIPTFPCVPSLRITAIDSHPNGEGYLKRQTELLDFQGRIYPLSLPESKAMEDYIETTLAARHIRPSMSPVAAGFFFVGKRDGGLGPCIDYRGLNAITIRYPYPLPLVPAALEQLGLWVAGPLTSLLRGKPKKLTWTDQARTAFQQLKNCFTTAPILQHPDPDLPFVVEVDASSSGLGVVLSQRHGEPGKLHPCAFYSRKLTSTEVNYDVGNRELLAIKAALEKWRHWLEGVRHPFQVLTDHRNLEYLRGVKRLNIGTIFSSTLDTVAPIRLKKVRDKTPAP